MTSFENGHHWLDTLFNCFWNDSKTNKWLGETRYTEKKIQNRNGTKMLFYDVFPAQGKVEKQVKRF